MFVEYSHNQKAFHLIEKDEMLKTNLDAILRQDRLDYIPIFEGTHKECQEFTQVLREKYNISNFPQI